MADGDHTKDGNPKDAKLTGASRSNRSRSCCLLERCSRRIFLATTRSSRVPTVQEAAWSFAKGDTLGRAYLETRSEVVGALADGRAAWLNGREPYELRVHVRSGEARGEIPRPIHLVITGESKRYWKERWTLVEQFLQTRSLRRTESFTAWNAALISSDERGGNA